MAGAESDTMAMATNADSDLILSSGFLGKLRLRDGFSLEGRYRASAEPSCPRQSRHEFGTLGMRGRARTFLMRPRAPHCGGDAPRGARSDPPGRSSACYRKGRARPTESRRLGRGDDPLLDKGIYVVGFSYPVVPQGEPVSACRSAPRTSRHILSALWRRSWRWAAPTASFEPKRRRCPTWDAVSPPPAFRAPWADA